MLAAAATLALVVAAGYSDLRTGLVPNRLTYPAVLIGLGLSLLPGGLAPGESALGLFAGFLAFYLLFAMGVMGGGDVKLMAAIGALQGYPFVLYAMFYSVFLAGVGAAVALVWRDELLPTLRDGARLIAQAATATLMPGRPVDPLPRRGGKLPFAVAICFGTLAALALRELSFDATGAGRGLLP